MHDKSTKMADLIADDLSPDEAKELFATEFDEPIRQLLGALRHLGFTDDDFNLLLTAMKGLMEATIEIPRGLTVGESMPFVYVSDLLTLGALSAEAYKRRDMIEDAIRAEAEQ